MKMPPLAPGLPCPPKAGVGGQKSPRGACPGCSGTRGTRHGVSVAGSQCVTFSPHGEPNLAAGLGINCAGVCWLHRRWRHTCRIPVAARPARCCLLSDHQLLFPRDPEVLWSWRAPRSRVPAAPHPSAGGCGELGEQAARGGGARGLARGGGEAAGLVSLVKRCRVPPRDVGALSTVQSCVRPPPWGSLGKKSATSRWSCGVEEQWSRGGRSRWGC